jgi:hypothetical protein
MMGADNLLEAGRKDKQRVVGNLKELQIIVKSCGSKEIVAGCWLLIGQAYVNSREEHGEGAGQSNQ